MALTLKQLQAFVQVADQGSFRRAAFRLNTTQPNISARIAALEEVLQTKLMLRDAGSVRLTPQGADLLDHARRILSGVDLLIAATGKPALLDGVLRLGVTELIVHTWLSRFLAELKAKAPNLLVELTVDVSANLSTALYDRALDMTFQSGPFARITTGNAPLGRSDLIWVAAPQLGLESRELDLDQLCAHPILTHARGTQPYDQLAAHVAVRKQKVRLVPSSNLAACLQMAKDGYGVACLPVPMVKTSITDGSLVPLNYAWRPDALDFAARYDAERAPHLVSVAIGIAQAQDQFFGSS